MGRKYLNDIGWCALVATLKRLPSERLPATKVVSLTKYNVDKESTMGCLSNQKDPTTPQVSYKSKISQTPLLSQRKTNKNNGHKTESSITTSNPPKASLSPSSHDAGWLVTWSPATSAWRCVADPLAHESRRRWVPLGGGKDVGWLVI